MDFGFPALNCIPRWRTWDSGLQSLVRFQIPKPTILDSTGKIIDLGFRNRRAKLLGFRIPGAKLLGFQIPRAKPLGVRNPDSLTWGDLFLGLHQRTGDSRTCGTCRRQATRLQPLPANYRVCMYVCMYVDLQHFPPDPVHTHNIRPGVRCRLQNGFISFCVESSIEKVDLRLLIFLQRLCTPVMEFSRASLFSKLRIKKSVDKFHKPVSKTYRPGPNCSKVGNGL